MTTPEENIETPENDDVVGTALKVSLSVTAVIAALEAAIKGSVSS